MAKGGYSTKDGKVLVVQEKGTQSTIYVECRYRGAFRVRYLCYCCDQMHIIGLIKKISA